MVVTTRFFQPLAGGNGYLPSLHSKAFDLETVAAEYAQKGIVEGSAWLTHDVEDALLNAKSGGTQMTNIGQLWKRTQDVIGVTPNLFDTALPGFLHVSESAVSASQLLPFLYSSTGSGTGIVGTLYKSDLGLSLKEEALLSFTMRDERSEREFVTAHRFYPSAFLDAAPAFKFSPFPAVRDQTVLVSLPAFLDLANGRYESVEELPLRAFLLKISSTTLKSSSGSIDALVADLENAIADLDATYVWDYRAATAPLESSARALAYVFTFTTVIAMAVCFFSLTSSMFTNVHEQSKEIAVLRALGLSKGALYRLFVHEAFVLVLASSLLGFSMGMVVSYTMTAQQILFTQLPIPFAFPWQVLIAVVLASVLFAFLASFYPIYRLMQLRVVQIFRILS